MTTEGLTAEQQPGQIDVDAVVRELDEAAVGVLPLEALRTCQRHREMVTPRLIDVLREAVRLGHDGTVREGEAHFFALFLLTEYKAKEALPVVLELFSLRDPVLEGVLGDTLTSIGKRVLAVLGADQPDLIESMILNRELDDYVRWEAAAALECMVRNERLKREEAVERLGRQMRAAMDAGDQWGVTITVCELADLNPLEMREEIQAAFERKLVDESIIDWHHFEEELLDPDQPGWCPAQERTASGAIEDTVEELQGWYCYSEEYRRLRAKDADNEYADESWEENEDDLELDESDFSFGFSNRDSTPIARDTIRHESPRVGRNDPCPCGSGKKYKKCCMRRGDGLA